MTALARKSKCIGIFDSGFGGLDIMRAIVRALPSYDYVYLGDTARTPYGNRSQETILRFTEQAVDFLFKQDCELIILACNTASSEALRHIQQSYLPAHHPGKRVLGVLIPAAEAAIEASRGKRIGVMATSGTVASRAFAHELSKFDPGVKVFEQACPLLVPFVEAGEHASAEAISMLERYLRPLLEKRVDTLILGCTHYGIMEKRIRSLIGPDIKIISEARILPNKLRGYLKRHPDLEKRLGKRSSARFYSTDLTDAFQTLGSKFFGRRILVRKAVL